ncbi:MAG TPA: serine hydrolase [Urbifossiella sp.]|jgi:D-alanyl-D-alanine carboxypeptidase (penicillin-binding protein 5/6)|nr:serine hydrolase [Urbifossiella sp.]
MTPSVLLLLALAQQPEPLPKLSPPDRPDGPPVVSAKGWAVADGQTGAILASSAPSEPLAIASTSKIMTAWLVLKLATADPKVLEETVTFSVKASQTGGTTSKLKAGEKLPARELLYGLLLPSGNDAAVALAEHFGYRFLDKEKADQEPAAAFIAEMNREAAALKMTGTRYLDPHGLGLNRSTARDLAVLAATALKNDTFRTMVATRRHSGTVTAADRTTRTVVWDNTNLLLRIEGYDGVKTGTTTAAGYCLVGSARRDGEHRIVVVLGATSNDSRYVDARNLFRWGWQLRAAP